MRAPTTDDRRITPTRSASLLARKPEDYSRLASRTSADLPSSDWSSTGATIPSPTRVVVIDDQAIVRRGIRVFLETDPEIKIVGEAESGELGVNLVRQLHPHVAVVDVVLRGMDGIATTAAIRREAPTTKVLALSSALEPTCVVGMIRAGATGYLAKDVRVADLCRAVRAVAAGQVQLAPEAAASLTQQMRAVNTTEPLTARESDVLHLLVSGMSNKGIGSALHITEKTVKTHVSNIIAKLGVESRTQAALMAVKQGLVGSPDQALAG